MANSTISALPTTVAIDPVNDFLAIDTASPSVTNKINRNSLLGLTSAPVGISDTQTLTGKTLTSPTINGATFSGTISGTYTLGGTPTFPSSVVTLTGTQTLTGKTLTSPTINGGTIDNTTITVDSISGHTSSTIVTVGGVQLNNGVIGTASAVTSTSIAPGAVQPQALVSGSGTGWTMATYSPTLTNISLGNGTQSFTYSQIGKQVFVRFQFAFGSTSTMTGSPQFSLPVTANANEANSRSNGMAYLGDLGNAAYPAMVEIATVTTFTVEAFNAAGTYTATTAVNGTIPFTWGTGDFFSGHFFYEAA